MEIKLTKNIIIPKDLSKEQCIGTGMAMVLILIILGLYARETGMFYFKAAVVVLLVNMTVPKLFYPLAIVWFGLANLMGLVMSKVILSSLFIVMVIPFGAFRKLLGHDAMRIKEWKKSKSSVFKDRNKTYSPADMIHPY